MKKARCLDHVSLFIAFRQAGAKEEPPYVDIERDVAALEMCDLHSTLALKDLDRHRRLLLSDPMELVEPVAQYLSTRMVIPNPFGVPGILVNDSARPRNEPSRHLVDEAVQRGRARDRVVHLTRIGDQEGRVKRAKALFQFVRCFPRSLVRDSLVEDDGEQKGESVLAYQSVRLGVGPNRDELAIIQRRTECQ